MGTILHNYLKPGISLVIFLFISTMGWGQGMEDFSNLTVGASYTDGAFVGNNSITWSYVASRDYNNTAGVTAPALMLRRDSNGSKVTSGLIPNGIGDFSVKLYKGFSGGGDRQVELLVNGVSQGVSTVFDDYNEHIFTVNGINIEGDVVIEIKNTTEKQIIIDDIMWTAYSSVNIDPAITNIEQSPHQSDVAINQPVSVSADIVDSDGILSANLYWGTASGSLNNQIPMSDSGMGRYTTDTDIPGQPLGTTVYYKIIAIDNSMDQYYTISPEQDYVVGVPLPEISNIQQNPAVGAVTSIDNVTVTADITTFNSTITAAELIWGTTSGDFPNVIPMSLDSGDTYIVDTPIPAQVDGTEVFYKVRGSNNYNVTGFSTEQSYTVADPIPFNLPYSNGFRDQADYDEAEGYGFVFDNTVMTSYLRIDLNGSVTTSAIDFSSYNELYVSASLRTYGTGSNRELTVSISNDNGGNYTPITTFDITSSTYTTFSHNIDLNSLNGANGRIKFEMTNGTGSIRLRDFTLAEITPCLDPTALTNTGLTANTIDMAWTAGNFETSWDISWGIPGFAPEDVNEIGNATSAETMYQITGLAENTSYDVYVQANCIGGLNSNWVGPYEFTTNTEGSEYFITTWTVTTDGESITIPTSSSHIYNYDVDWENNGTWETGFTDDATHVYTTAGTYTVAIRGNFPRIRFSSSSSNNQNKIQSVEQWGAIAWESMSHAFFNCSNLVFNATDTPDLSLVTGMNYMFRGATNFNGDLSAWDVSNVEDMSSMFYKAASFNQDIGNWDVSNVENMEGMFSEASAFNQDIGSWNVSNVMVMSAMFREASDFNQDISEWNVSNVLFMNYMFDDVTLSTENYDALLNGWSNLTLQSGVTFSAGNSQYCNGSTARDNIIATFGWDISDGGPDFGSCTTATDYFITTWKTDNPGPTNDTSITIPTFGSGYNYDVSWNNDGNWETGFTGNASHDYGTAGTYTVAIRGNFPRIYFDGEDDKDKILSIDQWGTIAWKSMEKAFSGCSNLGYNATDAPDLGTVTNMSVMFKDASSFNGDIGNWDVGNVTNMSQTFSGTDNFNQDIGNWDVSNVTDMYEMFSDAVVFNQDIGNWNVSSVENMMFMFANSNAFNQDIGNWNVSSVGNMMFMFSGADTFNQNIGNWNIHNVVGVSYMFLNALEFNQNLNNWNVSNVTNMEGVFSGASVFNGDIGNWNVSNVTAMTAMFAGATNFNQDISNWNVSNVTNMGVMFELATSFNQNLGNWNVSNVEFMNGIFDGVTLSAENYDALLNGWSNLTLQNGVTFNAGNSKYCSGGTARDTMINDFGWTITDDGQNCAPCLDFTAYTTANGWSNGLPTGTLTAVFIDDYNTNAGNINACSIEIRQGATVTVSEGTTISADNTIAIHGDLIFKSSASGNGELAAMGATSSIIGDATVHRYMKDRRSYRMVSSSVSTATSIHDNWQEGATSNIDNPNAGFGTHITGTTADQTNGFDGTITGNPSMFTVDVANQQFQIIANTDVNTLTAGEGYLLFVRGDRSIDLTDPTDNLSSETVLRASGSLVAGTNIQDFAAASANDFVMFGNPYQSTVDINSAFAASTNLAQGFYYVYDPSLGTYGSYVTVDLSDGSNTAGSSANQYLQPGQAAQVKVSGPATITFNESDKAPGNFTSTNRPLSGNDMLTVQMYTTENFNNGGPVHDSFGIIFAEGNDNRITVADAVKPMNFYENLGINKNGTYLSIEHRELPQAGEEYALYSAGYTKSEYTFKLTVDGLEANSLYLIDHYKGTRTLLEIGENSYNFKVYSDEPLSAATDRFAIHTELRLGVNDNNLLSGIRLFPNPLHGNLFYINAPNLNGEELTVSISDLTGRSISEQALECRDNTVTVPMGDTIASGVYMVTLKHGEETNTYRLIKE